MKFSSWKPSRQQHVTSPKSCRLIGSFSAHLKKLTSCIKYFLSADTFSLPLLLFLEFLGVLGLSACCFPLCQPGGRSLTQTSKERNVSGFNTPTLRLVGSHFLQWSHFAAGAQLCNFSFFLFFKTCQRDFWAVKRLKCDDVIIISYKTIVKKNIFIWYLGEFESDQVFSRKWRLFTVEGFQVTEKKKKVFQWFLLMNLLFNNL